MHFFVKLILKSISWCRCKNKKRNLHVVITIMLISKFKWAVFSSVFSVLIIYNSLARRNFYYTNVMTKLDRTKSSARFDPNCRVRSIVIGR